MRFVSDRVFNIRSSNNPVGLRTHGIASCNGALQVTNSVFATHHGLKLISLLTITEPYSRCVSSLTEFPKFVRPVPLCTHAIASCIGAFHATSDCHAALWALKVTTAVYITASQSEPYATSNDIQRVLFVRRPWLVVQLIEPLHALALSAQQTASTVLIRL